MPRVYREGTLEEYMLNYGEMYENGELWDFSKEDFENGAIEINEEQLYWLIGDRYYEAYDFDPE